MSDVKTNIEAANDTFPIEKQCTNCGKVAHRKTKFHKKNDGYGDGYQSWCKECQNKDSDAKKERKKTGTVNVVRVNLQRLMNRQLSTLQRVSLKLFKESQKEEGLDDRQIDSLVKVTKLVDDLLKKQKDMEKELTDEQLEAIAKSDENE